MGSSPLARGLHNAAWWTVRRHRIIPARAGFTQSSNRFCSEVTDHPRSRGVYARRSVLSSIVIGSSPLARGLRGAARAYAEAVMDHPRSRGVYRARRRDPWGDSGSSPLARGLHGGHGAVAHGIGIIPARAGFTRPRTVMARARTDHPRSRGVYFFSKACSISLAGSSPLARGLPVRLSEGQMLAGIIPARAGFTTVSIGDSQRPPDHPRSRGVYWVTQAWPK